MENRILGLSLAYRANYHHFSRSQLLCHCRIAKDTASFVAVYNLFGLPPIPDVPRQKHKADATNRRLQRVNEVDRFLIHMQPLIVGAYCIQ
jgi:hypothetical protein